ncbi:beta-1,6-N-acetylglucosaminyltransferase [Clostridium perfringens]|uniref:beta-1,6-N-acetylglucosaminyltransferase n=1 Tax=Clostridium perfringens TaxID=1502 RepID=UPI0024441A4F|nr:beta-1,6-N-acetylglucosaminyltransferase [Clostridium perfringens]MDG6885049.1 Core-2/I-Branching enzyme [Clostridium perfringens]
MKIAFLILCHIDEKHIERLANKLTKNEKFYVFIHVDKRSNIDKFTDLLKNNKSVIFTEKRYSISWGGYSAIRATMELIKCSMKHGDFDRYVLLQGLDYPLKSNKYIYEFFEQNKDVEFIRGCDISNSKEKYFYSRCRYYLFYEKINLFKKIFNYITYKLDIKLRDGYIKIDKKRYSVFWGSAQWALTRDCIDYIIKYYDNNKKFNKYFKTMFPVDELYFSTIVFNSSFKTHTVQGGCEEEKKGLVNWRNIHYFEYPQKIKVFSLEDFEMLKQRDELFVRKVNSSTSKLLLDKIDEIHLEKNK